MAIAFNTRCILRRSLWGLFNNTQNNLALSLRALTRKKIICLRELRLYALNKIREREVGIEIAKRHR